MAGKTSISAIWPSDGTIARRHGALAGILATRMLPEKYFFRQSGNLAMGGGVAQRLPGASEGWAAHELRWEVRRGIVVRVGAIGGFCTYVRTVWGVCQGSALSPSPAGPAPTRGEGELACSGLGCGSVGGRFTESPLRVGGIFAPPPASSPVNWGGGASVCGVGVWQCGRAIHRIVRCGLIGARG